MSYVYIPPGLNKFKPASLEEIDKVKLFNRIDTKFVVNRGLMSRLIDLLYNDYNLLYINKICCLPYRTRYYDTEEFSMYHNHVNGKLNRYKIRVRSYSATEDSFLETKFKTNCGRTIKKRIPLRKNDDLFGGHEEELLLRNTPYQGDDLSVKAYNSFSRIFLLNKKEKERITIDFDIKFSKDKENWTKLNNIIVFEVKQGRIDRSTKVFSVMKQQGIRSMGFSKYCVGTALLYGSEVKTNRLKVKLKHLEKLSKCYILG